jgi:hypothetical protein
MVVQALINKKLVMQRIQNVEPRHKGMHMGIICCKNKIEEIQVE